MAQAISAAPLTPPVPENDRKVCGTGEARRDFIDIALGRQLLFNEQTRATCKQDAGGNALARLAPGKTAG
jgi:hypothetical protein